jgi:CRP-like cAMP-binding protein
MASSNRLQTREFRNDILSALTDDEVERLRPLLMPVRWVRGQPLYEPDECIEHVYFPEQGFASTMAETKDANGRAEVGLTGREGVTGPAAPLDPGARSFNRVVVQLAGLAHRVPAQALREGLDALPTLRLLLLRALQVFMAQVAQTAACNSCHTLPERLARWLLMAHDRAEGDELELTQEFLSSMLAVRRPGVTIAVGALRTAGAIKDGRGHILIRDRAGLEAAACSCYARLRAFAAALAEDKAP